MRWLKWLGEPEQGAQNGEAPPLLEGGTSTGCSHAASLVSFIELVSFNTSKILLSLNPNFSACNLNLEMATRT